MEKLLNRARSIRSTQGVDDNQSTFNVVQSFIQNLSGASLEEELKQSSVYQKARAAAAEDLLASKIELLEEKYKLGKAPMPILCFGDLTSGTPEETMDFMRIEIDVNEENIRLLKDEPSLQVGKLKPLQRKVDGLEKENAVLRNETDLKGRDIRLLKHKVIERGLDITALQVKADYLEEQNIKFVTDVLEAMKKACSKSN